MEHAKCKKMDPEIFYPKRGQPIVNAIQICRVCPVKSDCLEYALANNERYGIWGGASERERRKIRRDRKQPPLAKKAAVKERQTRAQAARESCAHGHGAAVYGGWDRSGRQYCRECQRINQQRWREKNKALQNDQASA